METFLVRISDECADRKSSGNGNLFGKNIRRMCR